MTRNTPEDSQGELQGAIGSAYSLTAIIGPLVMTQIFGHFSGRSETYFPGAAFIAAAILIALAIGVFAIGAGFGTSHDVKAETGQ